MRQTHDHPLPGDLVIRETVDRTTVRATVTFIVTTYPYIDPAAGPYLSVGYAVRQARALAERRGGLLQVWRVDTRLDKPDYENVTED